MASVRVIEPGRVAYSMQLPVQSQSTVFAQEWERSAGPDELVRIAKAADRCGFFSIGVCDHVAIPRRAAAAMGTVWYDTVATLGLLAGVTERARLLSHVYVPAYRNPLLVAKAFATLDVLSGGRVILGVGVGHLAEEFAALGVDRPCPERGVRRRPRRRSPARAAAPSADLGGRIVAARPAPGGRAGRRVAAPGHAPQQDAGAGRLPPRAQAQGERR